jgi:ketosteroid isomerase-like protein
MSTPVPDVAEVIIGLERAAMDRWARGDPDGFLDLSAADVSYFDPFLAQRLDGLDGLRSLYDQIRGKIHIDRFAMIAPRVQTAGTVTVLTYRFDSYGSEGSMRWNTTEVFSKGQDGWKIIHTHWAFNQPKIAAE